MQDEKNLGVLLVFQRLHRVALGRSHFPTNDQRTQAALEPNPGSRAVNMQRPGLLLDIKISNLLYLCFPMHIYNVRCLTQAIKDAKGQLGSKAAARACL
jgi:hypothetical protein